MAENLNFDPGKWSAMYDNDPAYADTFGRVYFWKALSSVCPTGWHVPSDDEWKELEMYLGMSQVEADKDGWRGTDEGDKLKGDEALYNLSRINSNLTNAKVSIVGLSNDLKFTDFLDPRVKSSLGEENMIFPPYDASELQDILKQRVEIALKPNTIDDDVIPLCSALAAQEHGDARRALDLLRMSAELAERAGVFKITKKYVKLAQNKIEIDRIIEVVRTLPTQSKLVLLAILLQEKYNKRSGTAGAITTGEVYEIYKELGKKTRSDALTTQGPSFSRDMCTSHLLHPFPLHLHSLFNV